MAPSHIKKIIGLIILIIGAGCVIYAIHLLQRTHEAKQNASALATSPVEEPLGAIVGDVLVKKAGENDLKQAYLLIGSLAVLLSGGGLVLLFRNRG
jgi:flagellar basal body-associated protein FliL